MTFADLFDWFASDSKHVAEQTDDPKQRERWMSWQSCGRPPHDRAMTKRSAATLPQGDQRTSPRLKAPGQRGPGWLRIPASNTRSSQGLVFSRACALNRPRRCSAPVFGTMLGSRNTIETVFAFDETKFRL